MVDQAQVETTKKRSPKWTLASKPEMIIGAVVPSWSKSIPGPKYAYSIDTVKEKAPVYSMRTKPEMVIGGVVPSWVNTIPGPKYKYDADTVKQRQPVYTMTGRPNGKNKNLSASMPALSQEAAIESFNATKAKPPSFTLKSRTEMIPGDVVPSWVRSVPGPKYSYDVNLYKKRQPSWPLGQKLPTEADLMKSRSPGPQRYSGPATDATKQSEVDSTKSRTPAPGFGIGARWEGPAYEMVRSGASARYNRPR